MFKKIALKHYRVIPLIMVLTMPMKNVNGAQDGWVDLSAGIYRIEAEVANTYPSRDIGLTGKQALGDNQGMLFVFPQVERHCMWMRDTLLPLSAAFIDEQGMIVNVDEMQPQTDDYHCARKKVRYVLEMNQDWFNKHRIGSGAFISGIETVPPAH